MIFPTSPTASYLSSQLPSPLSPVFILQPPPLSSPLKNQAFVPSSFPPPITLPGAPVPTKTRTHCFCNHSALRQLSYNCNASVCAVTLSMVWRVTLDNTRFWEDEFHPVLLRAVRPGVIIKCCHFSLSLPVTAVRACHR